MKYLMTQEEFEILIGKNQDVPAPAGVTVIYFTATWCGACRSIKTDALEAAMPSVTWLKCDVDQNNYTSGYCGVRAIPTFLVVKDSKVLGTLQANQNEKVLAWVKELTS